MFRARDKEVGGRGDIQSQIVGVRESESKSPLEFSMKVLAAIGAEGCTRVEILHRVGTSWVALGALLGSLLERGFVTEAEEEDRKVCHLTPKGAALVSSYEELVARVREFVPKTDVNLANLIPP